MKFNSLQVVLALLVGVSGCSKNVDDGKIPVTTSSPEARKEFVQGRDLAEKLQLATSIQHFDKAIFLDSSFAGAYLNRANVAFSANDFFSNLKKAVAHAGEASEGERLLIAAAEAGAGGNTAKQKEALEKLVTLYPNDERAHFNLGNYYFGTQDYDRVIVEDKKAVELAPAYSPAYNILGYGYRQLEKYADAEAMFTKYIELIPTDPNPYDSYAELLLKMGRFDESIANYNRALAIDSTFISSRIGVATNLMYQGKAEGAMAELTKLYAMARNDGEKRQALFCRMIVCLDGGKMDAALDHLKKQYDVAEKGHDAGGMANDLGLQGNILLEMGKHAESLEAFTKAAEVIVTGDFSDDVKENAKTFLHYNKAMVAVGKKDLKKAAEETELFRKGIATKSNPFQIRLSHELSGRIALSEKNYNAAVTELLQANQQDPYNLYRIAVAYALAGEKSKAEEFCRKAAEFNSLPLINYAFARSKAQKMLHSL